MRRTVFDLLLGLALAALALTAHGAPDNFRQAKKLLSDDVLLASDRSFYCGCEITRLGKKLVPDHASCGFQPRKQPKRASRIEWEHVVPAHAFGHQLQCWQDGGRKNCRKDLHFRKMESDMHNLRPAIGEVNGDRSNFRLTWIEGEPRVYGECDFEVDFKRRQAEPTEHVRGDIARTYYYMANQYGLKLSSQDIRRFELWAKEDPVSAAECDWHARVKEVQGWPNPYVDPFCSNVAAD